MNDKSEQDLLRLCINKDERAWEEFYIRFGGLIRKTVTWSPWSFDTHEIEDLIQESISEIFKALPSFRKGSALSTFIVRITKNTCISQIRKVTAQKRSDDKKTVSLEEKMEEGFEFGVSTHDPFLMINQKEETKSLFNYIKKLSEECIKIIYLRFFMDYSYEEICSSLNLPMGTVSSRLKRCLLHLETIYTNKDKQGKILNSKY